MATHNDLGSMGEREGAAWLERAGHRILHRNWRSGRYELDLVTEREGKLHIIEVKTRKHSPVGHPEQMVNRRKFGRLKLAAHGYLATYPVYPRLQYDILAITCYTDRDPEFLLIEDVFI